MAAVLRVEDKSLASSDNPSDEFNANALQELDFGIYEGDFAYWTSLIAERRPRNLLELGCGFGRLVTPMTQAGMAASESFQTVGLDISASHLATAAKRLAQDPQIAERVTLLEADMTSFKITKPGSQERELFDLIVIACNGFGFLTGQQAQLDCLTRVREHLSADGVLAMDLIVPQLSYLTLAEKGSPLRMGRNVHDPVPGIRRLLRFDSGRYDAINQIDYDTYLYEIHMADGRVERRALDLTWQMVFPNELELLMKLAGLKVVERYGDLERGPFDRHSQFYLWVIEAA